MVYFQLGDKLETFAHFQVLSVEYSSASDEIHGQFYNRGPALQSSNQDNHNYNKPLRQHNYLSCSYSEHIASDWIHVVYMYAEMYRTQDGTYMSA